MVNNQMTDSIECYFTSVLSFLQVPVTSGIIAAITSISKHITSDGDVNELIINKSMKEKICNELAIGEDMLNKHFSSLKASGVLVPTKMRGVYTVHPLIISLNKDCIVKDLRWETDCASGLITTNLTYENRAGNVETKTVIGGRPNEV